MRLLLLPTLSFIALVTFVVADQIALSASQVNRNDCILGPCNTEKQTPGFTDMKDSSSLPFGWSTKSEFHYPSPNSTIVAGILSHLSKAETQANLEHFTSYHTRYFNSDVGKASSEWLYANILTYTAELASEEQKGLISVEAIEHPWKQNSFVIRIAPPNALQFAPITILGAHIDTLNHGGIFLAAPGADDDGSGTVTILEAYRALLLGNYIPVSPLEFHFYAGEEGGLRGSHVIASRYAIAGKKVRGMVQFDMTAWHQAGTREEIGVIMNNVDAALSEFQILLIERYLQIPFVRDHYPQGSRSDYVSWTDAGYPSCHPLEGQVKHTNPHIHSVNDTIAISPEFSFDHMLQYVPGRLATREEHNRGQQVLQVGGRICDRIVELLKP